MAIKRTSALQLCNIVLLTLVATQAGEVYTTI